MAEYKMSLDTRTATGKKVKDLRAKGLIPGVVYGGDMTPIPVQSEYVATEKVLMQAGYHSPIDGVISGKAQMVMVKNVDIDPVKRTIRNVEYLAISADEIVEATTPIVIVGFEQSPANVAKLSLMQVLEEIEVEAKPADLPKSLEVDGSVLVDDDSKLTVADIKLPKGVEFVDHEIDMELAVAIVIDPAAETAAREAEDKTESVAAADVPSESGAKPEEAAEAKTEE